MADCFNCARSNCLIDRRYCCKRCAPRSGACSAAQSDRPDLLRYAPNEFSRSDRERLYCPRCWAERSVRVRNRPQTFARNGHATEPAMTMVMESLGYDNGEAIPYVDSRIYSDRGIFEEEVENIWTKVWLVAVHESELP